MTDRRFLGVVEVDSGRLLLGDPTYVGRLIHEGLVANAAAFVEGAEGVAKVAPPGVLLVTGFGGDGTYPVFGEFDEVGLARLTVEFVGPDESA